MNNNDIVASDTRFSFDRYADELKRIVNENPRTTMQYLLIVPAVVMATCFLAEFSMLSENIANWTSIDDPQLCRTLYDKTLILQFSLLIMLFFVLGAASMSVCFRSLRDASTRVVALMRPVRASETLAAQATLHGLGFVAIFVVSALVVDIIRPVFFTVYKFNYTTYFTSMWSLADSVNLEFVRFILSYLAFWLFTCSCYLLGAVFVPKGTFVKTTVFLAAIFIALLLWSVTVAVMSDCIVGDILDMVPLGLYSTFFVILSVVNYFIALMRLKEYTVR